MKVLHIFLGLWMLVCLSCSGFLDEVDQDKFIPSTTDHYASVLLEEFNKEPGIMPDVAFMTDEIQELESSFASSSYRNSMLPIYTWQRDIERTFENEQVGNNTSWGRLYRNIAIVNYVIEQIDDATGTEAERDYVKGEAYFIRAYCYFSLTNLYAEPYRSAAGAEVTMGVPLRTDIGVVPTYDRAMLSDNYRQIEEDLGEAIRLIGNSGLEKSIYHPTVAACRLLLSRVQLFQKKYDDVITTATGVMEVTGLKKLTAGSASQPFITKSNPEVLYSFGGIVQVFSVQRYNVMVSRHTGSCSVVFRRMICVNRCFLCRLQINPTIQVILPGRWRPVTAVWHGLISGQPRLGSTGPRLMPAGEGSGKPRQISGL